MSDDSILSRILFKIFCPVLLLGVSLHAAEIRPPNILFILIDDQGSSTLSCYGGKQVPTPNIDRLAQQGIRFTDAYVMPQCTPTRAALLSGQHTARNGMWHVIPWYGSPWARVAEPMFRDQYPREEANLPKALRAAGYKTGMAGKWHLNTNRDGDYMSLKQAAGDAYGFDFVAPRGEGSQNEGDKWVDHLTDQAISFIKSNKDQPWFFYLAHHTLHAKLSAPPELVKKYLAQGAPAEGLHNATYLAAIEHMDNSIGRLMAALEEMKLRENTLVVFLTDNGGVYQQMDFKSATESSPLKVAHEEFANAPLRAGKGSAYEGGIRVPCIVRWPAQVKAEQVCETPIHVTDWMPTLLAVAGAKAPDKHPLDGVSLLPLLQGEFLTERPLFWYMPLYDLRWAATPCAVIRVGDWKLIESFGDWFDPQNIYQTGAHLELYNLRQDLGEKHDLSTVAKSRAEAMQSQLHQWMASVPVPIPSSNAQFDVTRQFEESKIKP
ncbi:sulfatase [soil metagenome]